MGRKGILKETHTGTYTHRQAYILRGFYLATKNLTIEDVRYMLAIARYVARKLYEKANSLAKRRGWKYKVITISEWGYKIKPKHMLYIRDDEYDLSLFV